jgi:hypothetical protein
MDLTKPNQNITYKVGATNFELQRAIEAALPAAVAQTKDLAKNFKGSTEKESCSKIFNFLKNNIQYKVDGDNQKIKLPSAFLRERSGDCKSFSLFTAAILSNLKIPFSFTYASYNPNDKTPEHIYVTTKNGCIIDAVWGKFNSEKKPCYKFQKPMNISYISGIKKHHSEKYEKREEKYHNIGNVFSKSNPALCGFQGLGRTGLDWGNAVGRSFSAGEVAEYLSKNTALAPARGILLMFIRNNGGGIASFLYSLAFRETPYELPNNKKFNDEFNAGQAAISQKYNSYKVYVWPADALIKYQNAVAAYSAKNPNATSTQIASVIKKVDFLTSAQRAIYNLSLKSNAEITALIQADTKILLNELGKKYPLSSRFLPIATSVSKEKYRGIEWKWFWNLGGSPDDLNDAVKEGNTKSPRGRDANYMLNKAYNGGLSFSDLGLVIRGIVSAEAGDKFGLGEEGTYVVAINGQKRIGLDPVTASATAAVITTYSAAIIPIVAFIMQEIRATLPAQTDASQNPTPFPTGGEDSTSFLSGNTGMILLAAAGVGAYLYLKK